MEADEDDYSGSEAEDESDDEPIPISEHTLALVERAREQLNGKDPGGVARLMVWKGQYATTLTDGVKYQPVAPMWISPDLCGALIGLRSPPGEISPKISIDHESRLAASYGVFVSLISVPREQEAWRRAGRFKKIVCVPSVGLPSLLQPELAKACRTLEESELAWVRESRDRLVVLVVHHSERHAYESALAQYLEPLNIAFAVWEGRQGQRSGLELVGFGQSREACRVAAALASQLFGAKRNRYGTCDHNVLFVTGGHTKESRDALAFCSDEEGAGDSDEEKSTRGTKLLWASGAGSAETRAHRGELKKLPSASKGRPLEQAVVVTFALPYSPCFVTHGEDKAQQKSLGPDRVGARSNGKIVKMALGAATTHNYSGFIAQQLQWECQALESWPIVIGTREQDKPEGPALLGQSGECVYWLSTLGGMINLLRSISQRTDPRELVMGKCLDELLGLAFP